MEEAQLKRIQDVADNIGKLRRWGEVYGGKSVPKGLIQHVELVCLDVVAQNDRIKNRQQLHQQSILRTNEMERYYTLPHLHGPAMPTTRAQAPGVCPQRFTWMQHVPKFHPLQLPDRWEGANCYPA
ncbi:hypothetical protein AGDE_08656 [Angomonas deanei]|nr:hypothetical protein AGDE_08656 [Angomonas deanei]|eukprot:EPY32477.1 hypothetical protein AGDE_08656 [Angomonas deanei]